MRYFYILVLFLLGLAIQSCDLGSTRYETVTTISFSTVKFQPVEVDSFRMESPYYESYTCDTAKNVCEIRLTRQNESDFTFKGIFFSNETELGFIHADIQDTMKDTLPIVITFNEYDYSSYSGFYYDDSTNVYVDTSSYFSIYLKSIRCKAGSSHCMQDLRDDKTYRTVNINGTTWMAENLGYAMGYNESYNYEYSYCYNSSSDYNSYYAPSYSCELRGRLYNATAALGSACPTGWHLPTDMEWNDLEHATGMASHYDDSLGFRGTHASALRGNADLWPEGTLFTGDLGFNATSSGSYDNFGGYVSYSWYYDDNASVIYWSSTTDSIYNNLYTRTLFYDSLGVKRSTHSSDQALLSIRCVKD